MPTLTAASLVTPHFSGLEPREITLSVVDQRPLPEPARHDTEQQLTGALRRAFAAGGLKVQDGSRHRLAIELSYPDHPAAGMESESCVDMDVEFTLEGRPALRGTAMGCAEHRNLFGMSYGPDTSQAFEQAADTLLKELDAELDRLPPR